MTNAEPPPLPVGHWSLVIGTLLVIGVWDLGPGALRLPNRPRTAAVPAGEVRSASAGFSRTRMSIELCVLGSGSAGNSSVVRTPGGVMLIDAGLGPRTVAQRMKGLGVGVADISAICLTHLDRDHFNLNWVGTILKLGIRVFCHEQRRRPLLQLAAVEGLHSLVEPFDAHPFEPLPGLAVRPVSLAHDAEGSHGFCLVTADHRMGFATDLGRVPDGLIDCFEGVDLLAIESNYDPVLQRGSGRPWFLVQRIMGGRGHLSNEQALDAVKRIVARTQTNHGKLPAHVVLLHRSRECNCPQLLRDLFSRDSRIAPRLVLAEQYERTAWLRADGAVRTESHQQLALSWG
jgi:phosphoribosyl 1,2-cyclic phosphodiesterase